VASAKACAHCYAMGRSVPGSAGARNAITCHLHAIGPLALLWGSSQQDWCALAGASPGDRLHCCRGALSKRGVHLQVPVQGTACTVVGELSARVVCTCRCQSRGPLALLPGSSPQAWCALAGASPGDRLHCCGRALGKSGVHLQVPVQGTPCTAGLGPLPNWATCGRCGHPIVQRCSVVGIGHIVGAGPVYWVSGSKISLGALVVCLPANFKPCQRWAMMRIWRLSLLRVWRGLCGGVMCMGLTPCRA
jgi:hypothetical protein